MKNGLPYYKAYPRDFFEGTIGMDFEVKCAYRLLLDMIYMHAGHLPDDPAYIAGLLGCNRWKWNKLRFKILETGKIAISGNSLTNSRVFQELEISDKFRRKQSENRLGYRKNKDLQKPNLNHTESESYKEKRTPIGVPKEKGPRQVLEDVLGKDLAGHVLEHRQRLRKPLTTKAAEMLAASLSRCRDPKAAAEVMIEFGWLSVKPEWVEKAVRKRNDRFTRKMEMADRLDRLAEADSKVAGREDRGDTLPLLPPGDE